MLILGVLLVVMALVAFSTALGLGGVSAKSVRQRLGTGIGPAGEETAQRVRSMFADSEGIGWGRILTTRRSAARIDRNLQLAGRPVGWTVRRFATVKAASTLASVAVGALLIFFDPSRVTVFLAIVLVFMGVKVPDVILQRRAADRQEAIRRTLPDVLDQTSISIESGLSLEAAMAHVGEGSQTALGEEFVRTLQDMRVGMSRKDAYEALADRTDVDDLKRFIKSILQADEFGVSVATVVANQAADIRVKRRFEAEARALQVPVKMLFPLLVCLFPVLFVVVLTPAILNLNETLANR